MKEILKQLYQRQYLSRPQACSALTGIANDMFNPVEVAAFLSVFNMRNIAIDELKGFRDGMLELCTRVDLDAYKAMDVCGTGGDGKNTFNISTLSAFVIAGAGIPVAKHGNYGVSSVSGSSNVMEYLGVRFREDGDGLKRQLDRANICFIHAPYFHPGMKAVAPVRKQLGLKTFFNMLGPLSNPAQPGYQMIGLYHPDLLRMYQYILQDENRQFSLVHSVAGYDEVSLTSGLKYVNNKGEHYFEKEQLTCLDIRDEDLYGGETIDEAARIFMNVLEGKGTEAQNEVVIINSALAIQTRYPELDLAAARDRAADSICNHKALDRFNQLKNMQ